MQGCAESWSPAWAQGPDFVAMLAPEEGCTGGDHPGIHGCADGEPAADGCGAGG